MKFKKSLFVIFLVVFAFNFSEVRAKVILEDDPELTDLQKGSSCNTGGPELLATDDSIKFESEIYDKKTETSTPTKESPFFKLYDNEKFVGPAVAELNQEGFFLSGVKKCYWGMNYPGCSKTWLLGTCKLFKIDSPKNQFQRCDSLVNYFEGFKVDDVTSEYYTMKIEGKKYYLNRKGLPYDYIESRAKKSEALKQKLFSRINKNFKKHQKDFIDYVEQKKKCLKEKDEKCIDEIVGGNFDFTDYLCLDRKIKCDKKSVSWRAADKEASLYQLASMPECFDYEKMEIMVTDYKDDGKFQIYKVLNGYDRNVTCAYDIVLHEDKKDEIRMSLVVRIDMESALIKYEDNENADVDQKVKHRFKSTKEMEIEQRACHQINGKSKVIPSRLHDKALQKLE